MSDKQNTEAAERTQKGANLGAYAVNAAQGDKLSIDAIRQLLNDPNLDQADVGVALKGMNDGEAVVQAQEQEGKVQLKPEACEPCERGASKPYVAPRGGSLSLGA